MVTLKIPTRSKHSLQNSITATDVVVDVVMDVDEAEITTVIPISIVEEASAMEIVVAETSMGIMTIMIMDEWNFKIMMCRNKMEASFACTASGQVMMLTIVFAGNGLHTKRSPTIKIKAAVTVVNPDRIKLAIFTITNRPLTFVVMLRVLLSIPRST